MACCSLLAGAAYLSWRGWGFSGEGSGSVSRSCRRVHQFGGCWLLAAGKAAVHVLLGVSAAGSVLVFVLLAGRCYPSVRGVSSSWTALSLGFAVQGAVTAMFCVYSCTQVQSKNSQCAKEQRAAYCLVAAHDSATCPRHPTQVPNPARGRALVFRPWAGALLSSSPRPMPILK